MFRPPHEDDPADLDPKVKDVLDSVFIVAMVVVILVYGTARMLGY